MKGNEDNCKRVLMRPIGQYETSKNNNNKQGRRVIIDKCTSFEVWVHVVWLTRGRNCSKSTSEGNWITGIVM